MQVFEANQLAFHVWSYVRFPLVLSYGAVHSSWNRRLYPYDKESRRQRRLRGAQESAIPQVSSISLCKLWMTTTKSIHFTKVPDDMTRREQICQCLSNLQEARITSWEDCCVQRYSSFCTMISNLRKLTCSPAIFYSFLRAHVEMSERTTPSALREIVLVDNNNSSMPLFDSYVIGSQVLAQITHFTVEGTHLVNFSDLLLLPQLQVFSSLLQPTDTHHLYLLQSDYSMFKHLRLIRLSNYLALWSTQVQFDKLRANSGVEIEIVE